MAEKGETSGSKPSDEIWAKLVPLNTNYSDIKLNLDEMIIFSEANTSSFETKGWCKITRNSDLCSAAIRNMSSNGIIVNGTVLESGDTSLIKCGSEIVMVPNPSDEGSLSYKFKLMAAEEQSKKLLQICLDVEHAKCSICLSIWHDVVTAAPCLHNFCNGCFSEWLKRSQEKHASVICPQCRAVVQFVGRNHFLHNIEEHNQLAKTEGRKKVFFQTIDCDDITGFLKKKFQIFCLCGEYLIRQDILKSDSSLKRSDEEYALLDSYASIKSPLVINMKRTRQRKRDRSPLNEESVATELPCPQCGTQYGGFQCNQTTVHLQCQSCGGMMPSRTNTTVPQHCVGCDRAFCGVYWEAHSVTATDSHPVCSPETLKNILERTIARIPFSAHESNRHEQDITERCIRQTGKTLQNVISEWITKFNNREIDRANMPLKHAETITAATHVCNDCYDKLVSYLLYWYRVSLPRHLLPADASQRENCWYGYRCRTQHHSEEHARKRNHVCRPTRGSIL